MPDNVENLSTSLAKDIAPQEKHVVLKPNFTFKNPFVCEMNNVIISGQYAAAKTTHGKYVADMLNRPTQHDDLHTRIAKSMLCNWTFSDRFSQTQSITHIDTCAVIHRASGSQNFYHWMIDHILKLRGVEFYEKKTGNEVTLIISEHTPDFATEAIEILGFGNNPIKIWKNNNIHAENLIVPSWPEPTPGNLRWIQKNVGEVSNESNNKAEWIYISRQNAPRGRKITNFDEVAPILEEYGIDIIRCEEMSLREEISLFRSVDGIIGPHGAGLTGMIWTNSLSVIELCNGIVKMPFYTLAHLLDHEYTYLMGTAEGGQSEQYDRDRDFSVRPSLLRKVLDEQLKNK